MGEPPVGKDPPLHITQLLRHFQRLSTTAFATFCIAKPAPYCTIEGECEHTCRRRLPSGVFECLIHELSALNHVETLCARADQHPEWPQRRRHLQSLFPLLLLDDKAHHRSQIPHPLRKIIYPEHLLWPKQLLTASLGPGDIVVCVCLLH